MDFNHNYTSKLFKSCTKPFDEVHMINMNGEGKPAHILFMQTEGN